MIHYISQERLTLERLKEIIFIVLIRIGVAPIVIHPRIASERLLES